jgi:flagellar basal-body rod protein FlgB
MTFWGTFSRTGRNFPRFVEVHIGVGGEEDKLPFFAVMKLCAVPQASRSEEATPMFRLVDKLSVGLSKASLRQTVLSNNLANVNTPGFKRSDVVDNLSFSSELSQAQGSSLRRTHAKHLSGGLTGKSRGAFSVVQDTSTTMRTDGNNVDVERERVLLLENQLYYESLIDAVTRKLGQLRSVIGEGRR